MQVHKCKVPESYYVNVMLYVKLPAPRVLGELWKGERSRTVVPDHGHGPTINDKGLDRIDWIGSKGLELESTFGIEK